MKNVLLLLALVVCMSLMGCAQKPYDASGGLNGASYDVPVYLPSMVVNNTSSSGYIESNGVKIKQKCITWHLESEDSYQSIINYYDQNFPGNMNDFFSPKMDFGDNIVSYKTPDNSLTVMVNSEHDSKGSVSKFTIAECN